MATLSILAGSQAHRLSVPEGRSVREALDATDLRVRAACGGSGTCGACVVRLLGGAVSAPTVAEFLKLRPEERAEGRRLACQLRLQGDAEILLDQPAPPSCWKSIPEENLAAPAGGRPELDRHVYGLAVDLGTTHIRLSLWDRRRGKRIASRRGPNPQGDFGADVLNRLDAARASPERAAELARLARTSIIQAVRDILSRDMGEVKPLLAQIGEIVLVGNTAMLALLTGRGAHALADPANWEAPVDVTPADPDAWQAGWFMPNARIRLPAPVAGFVGSDLLADLVATRLTEGPPASLLLDIGTNTEIALWDGRLVHVTSVPGGPAFEGVGLRNGMPAEAGAIARVRQEGEAFALATIGGSAARGFCGSGLVDAVAVLLGTGRLRPTGRFVAPPGPDGFALDPANPRTALTASDVDAFQRAKAATAAGLLQMLRQAGMAWQDVRRLVLCGAFGRELDAAHAQSLGLLPPVDPACIELQADASLAGCERVLLARDGGETLEKLRGQLKLVNLSCVPGYEDSYVDHLRLAPIAGDAAPAEPGGARRIPHGSSGSPT